MSNTKSMSNTKMRRPAPPNPAKTVTGILNKQRDNLSKVIKHLSHMEEKRASRLDRTESRAERERLEARFAMERENDQRRVMTIRDDYEKLKKSVAEGTFSEGKVQQRYREQMIAKKLPRPIADYHNRFQGLETPADVILFKANVHMFEKYDAKYRERIEVARHLAGEEERYKLGLLNERKDVLKQLIDVRQREIREATVQPGQPSSRVSSARSALTPSAHFLQMSQQNRNNAAPSRARPSSSSSTVSAASTASWASFASKSSTRPRYGAARESSIKPVVPRLAIK